MNVLGKATKLNKLPEPVGGDFLKSHMGNGYYLAFTAGRIAIEWGDGHPANPRKMWWRFAKPDMISTGLSPGVVV